MEIISYAALSIKIAGFDVEMLAAAAFRTLEALRPALFEQVLPALLLSSEIPLKFDKRHLSHLRAYYRGLCADCIVM